jgi:hypothetical protein
LGEFADLKKLFLIEMSNLNFFNVDLLFDSIVNHIAFGKFPKIQNKFTNFKPKKSLIYYFENLKKIKKNFQKLNFNFVDLKIFFNK